MSYERDARRGTVGKAASAPEARVVGKQTLTSGLEAAPVQRHAAGTTAGADVHQAAAHGTRGPATTLPHLDVIQRSFGSHDVGHIQAHVGGEAAEGTSAMGADAFAMGEHVAFARQPDLHTAAHEAAHVVQQRGGVQLKGGVGEAGDPYERHADAVADLVVQGTSSESLLDEHAGTRGAGAGGSGAVQRHAFVGGAQVTKDDPDAVGAVAGFVTDDIIRSYETKDELKQHAGGQTDYLGNLADGTWMRFSPTGINLLGEDHTLVTLEMVVPAVGSKSFIYEPFSSDSLGDGSAIKSAYETENADRFKTFGIDQEKDKQKFGAESLFPKMGFGMNLALPYFDGSRKIKELEKAKGYVGQPVQRYLKIGWGYGKDCKAEVAQKKAAKQPVKPKLEELAKVVTSVEGELDPFIAGLPVDGWLGDAFKSKPANAALLPLLARFATAFIDAMVEQAIDDPSSRMDAAKKQKYAGATSSDEKDDLFSDWRNFKFEDSVKDAAKRGVRYAGMGQAHLEHLTNVGLPANGHPFEMAGKDLAAFKKETAGLKKIALKQ